MSTIEIKELAAGAMGQYATKEAAALDLKAVIQETIILKPNEQKLIGSGIALNMQGSSLAAMILPRSGLGSKGLVLGNLVGLIDADYQGEIKIASWNRGEQPITIEPMMRIAQLLFINVEKPKFNIVNEFTSTSIRGEQGFGHTGT